jgi:hypothetical protein
MGWLVQEEEEKGDSTAKAICDEFNQTSKIRVKSVFQANDYTLQSINKAIKARSTNKHSTNEDHTAYISYIQDTTDVISRLLKKARI